ncbi:C-type lectin domain family 12 member B-like isoform X2 [Xiphias gladius]|uniref:C-type lectin domain family 12 member B-like isoform X2 n=1 Tax=Xiphias gladius TaxID=8245 RepID=UPI001A991CA6|nr:C-type lectin domain family 12 member B-like isoform X2 [Xiphias gladius]
MEEELNYATVVFKNGGGTPKEKNEDFTIYSTVKTKGSATTVPNGEAAAHSQHLRLLAVCLGIICVLLVGSLIYIGVVMSEQKAKFTANLSNLTAENQQLVMKNSNLESKTEELSRDRDDLNWTLTVILKFNSFPVDKYCPQKQCQPCQRGWILFQEKCYLFYMEYRYWKTWRESQIYCQSRAADLVVIDSLQEQEFISNHIEYYYDKYHGYWFGLHQTADKTWLWVNGHNETLGYWTAQAAIQLGEAGPCALMIPERNPTASWNTARCKMLNRFICESEVLIRSN